jgi:ribonuclease HI
VGAVSEHLASQTVFDVGGLHYTAPVRERVGSMKETITIQFDGGSRGNPGPAGIGVVLRAEDGTPLVTLGKYIGRATNNVAEYRALITGLEKAMELGAKKIVVRGDSELIVRQMVGTYRVKNVELKQLYDEAQTLYRQFDEARIEHNYREKNELADRLANLAMDRKAEVTDAEDSPLTTPEAIAPETGDLFNCVRCGCSIELKQPSRIRPHQLKPFVCQCGSKMDGPE